MTQGKNISGLHKTRYSLLGKEPNVGKEMDLCDLGTSMGKEREKGMKADSWLYTAYWSVHFYDYAQGLTSTVCLISLNSLSNYFSILCACAGGGSKFQQLEWDPGSRVHVSVVPATGGSADV